MQKWLANGLKKRRKKVVGVDWDVAWQWKSSTEINKRSRYSMTKMNPEGGKSKNLARAFPGGKNGEKAAH